MRQMKEDAQWQEVDGLKRKEKANSAFHRDDEYIYNLSLLLPADRARHPKSSFHFGKQIPIIRKGLDGSRYDVMLMGCAKGPKDG
jgi:hypothetical protein